MGTVNLEVVSETIFWTQSYGLEFTWAFSPSKVSLQPSLAQGGQALLKVFPIPKRLRFAPILQ